MTEIGIKFEFNPRFHDILKFDETTFYRSFKDSLPNGKGVDFIANSKESLLLIEVKNCKGYEHANIWRTSTDKVYIKTNNDDINKPVKSNKVVLEESLDIEVSKKISCTLACLLGANTKNDFKNSEELQPYLKDMVSTKFMRNEKNIIVMLFLEGDFGSKTRTKKMIMDRLQSKLKSKLSWLNCKVMVVDSTTHNDKYFNIL